MNYKHIIKLVHWAEEYENEFPEKEWDEEDFRQWLIDSEQQEKTKKQKYENQPIDGWIAMLLGYMTRYVAFYGRRLFKDHVIYSFDDFGVLVTLYPDHKQSKSAVMKQLIMEKSSGNEVLKRMLKRDLLQESNNPEDKRSKLIALTDAGRKAMEDIQGGIGQLSALVAGDLAQEEKQVLLKILMKLNDYHKPIFEDESNEEIDKRLGLG